MSLDTYFRIIKYLSVTAHTGFDLVGIEVFLGWHEFMDELRMMHSERTTVTFRKGRCVTGIQAGYLTIANIENYSPQEKHPLLVASEDCREGIYTIDCFELIERGGFPVTIPGLMTIELCSE